MMTTMTTMKTDRPVVRTVIKSTKAMTATERDVSLLQTFAVFAIPIAVAVAVAVAVAIAVAIACLLLLL